VGADGKTDETLECLAPVGIYSDMMPVDGSELGTRATLEVTGEGCFALAAEGRNRLDDMGIAHIGFIGDFCGYGGNIDLLIDEAGEAALHRQRLDRGQISLEIHHEGEAPVRIANSER